jgi:hypothetical protein
MCTRCTIRATRDAIGAPPFAGGACRPDPRIGPDRRSGSRARCAGRPRGLRGLCRNGAGRRDPGWRPCNRGGPGAGPCSRFRFDAFPQPSQHPGLWPPATNGKGSGSGPGRNRTFRTVSLSIPCPENENRVPAPSQNADLPRFPNPLTVAAERGLHPTGSCAIIGPSFESRIYRSQHTRPGRLCQAVIRCTTISATQSDKERR